MDSTHAENRRPGRENARKGFAEDDINIPYRGMLQSARRLQETRELLASPGPLESMLRTTTETGDIGLYSVRPSRSSSRARTPLHPAATLAGSELARTTSMNAPERRHFRDGRRGPPAQRDATSEIVALYGPNRLRSTPASFSRSPDDPAPRSYSLTSCSSRYMSDQKSTGTWDSRSSGGSGGGLPRPRSPYPYHTRLKRPGVRPSSPALTLDGGVDYSRMVEIDRPSYRTIPRSYGRSYPPNLPRHPHPRVRPLLNQVSLSLPVDADTAMLSPQRNAAATPRSPRINDTRDQIASGSSEQSVPVSSSTSMVPMYPSPAAQPAVRQPPVSCTGSFYYDYSEDFQEHSVPVPPLPRRGPSTHRPFVRDNSCRPIGSAGPLADDATPARPPSAGPSSPAQSKLEPEADLPKVQHHGDKEGAPFPDSTEIPPWKETIVEDQAGVLPDVAPDKSKSGASPIVSEGEEATIVGVRGSNIGPLKATEAPDNADNEKKREQVQVETDDLAVSDTATRPSATHSACGPSSTEDDVVGDATADRSPETPSAVTDSAASRGSESTRRSGAYIDTPSLATRRSSNVYSLQPGLLDLKSFVQDLDEAGLLQEAGNLVNSSRFSSAPDKTTTGADVHALLAQTNKILEAEADRISKYGSMREPAVCSTITRLKTDVFPEKQCADNPKPVILAPQPVSPARQLRLRSSVSKLMKALPPIPSGMEQEATTNKQSVERELPALPTAPQVSSSGSGQAGTVPERSSTCAQDSQGGVPSVPLPGNAETSHAGEKRPSRDIYGEIWDMHFGMADDDPMGKVGGTGSSNTIAIGMMKGAEDSLGSQGFSGSARQLHPPAQRGNFKSSTVRSKPLAREMHANVNLISQRRGSSLDTSRSAVQRPQDPSKHSTSVNRSGLIDETRPPRGLKKRLSDFKIRLTESRHRGANWSSPDADVRGDGEIIGIAVPVTSSTVSPESGGGTSNPNSAGDDASARGLRYKLSRWMKSAKKTVNSCKRLSSSTGGTSLDTDF